MAEGAEKLAIDRLEFEGRRRGQREIFSQARLGSLALPGSQP